MNICFGKEKKDPLKHALLQQSQKRCIVLFLLLHCSYFLALEILELCYLLVIPFICHISQIWKAIPLFSDSCWMFLFAGIKRNITEYSHKE